jgi:hypothetical protein
MTGFPETDAGEPAEVGCFSHEKNLEAFLKFEKESVPVRGEPSYAEYPLIDHIPLQQQTLAAMPRVSSCYFSVQSERSSQSVADLFSLLDEDLIANSTQAESSCTGEGLWLGATPSSTHTPRDVPLTFSTSDLLYHDILMHVFTFLDAPSLAAVSETARRLNFEVFYFLQLQVQKALLLPDDCGSDSTATTSSLSAMTGVSIIRRLAAWNHPDAAGLVQEFLESNTSLGRLVMLPHSLASLRQALQNHRSQFQASAALLVTLWGAASLCGDSMAEVASSEIPQMIFRVGLCGSLMKAAHQSMQQQDNNNKTPLPLPQAAGLSRVSRMAIRFQQASQLLLQEFKEQRSDEGGPGRRHLPSWAQLAHMVHITAYGEEEAAHDQHGGRQATLLWTPNPYAHTTTLSLNNDEQKEEENEETSSSGESPKEPTGCIGAYLRTVRKADRRVAELIRECRRERFLQLSLPERVALAGQFLQACTRNDSLEQVQTIVRNSGVEVDGFYVGADGTETCALHTAALNGASQVIEFLCGGVGDESGIADGGLCDVNRRDSNAWTALHFAAGSNSVEAVRVLVKHGADWTVEANNGYTPYQWAVRLQNHRVAQEFRDVVSNSHRHTHGWIAHRPLSVIASRFLAFVMVHSE